MSGHQNIGRGSEENTRGSRKIRAVRNAIRAVFRLYEWFGSIYERFALSRYTRVVTQILACSESR